MHRDWRIVFRAAICVVCGVLAAAPAVAGIPDPSNSFYVPQAGDPDPVGALGGKDGNAPAALFEGPNAFRFFRACPNNDGGASLPNNARIKIILRDINNNPIPNVAAGDICVLFNGGTPAQLFSGVGADSVIANSQWNTAPLCPDVRCIPADGPTNAAGITFITFTGVVPGARGVGARDGLRKWGHYDTKLPVYALGFELLGRLTSGDPTPGTYTLRIKNFDWTGGLGAVFNQGESVTATDFNGVANGIGVNNAVSYWRDFDFSGAVATADFNIISQHVTHDCDTPNSP